MKYYIPAYIILLLLFANVLLAQDYEKDKKFINEVVSHEGKMIVFDCLPPSQIQEIKDDFNSDTIQISADTLILTNAELKYIHDQLNKMDRPYLKSDLFDSTQIVSPSSIHRLFKKGIGEGWEAFYKRYSPKGYYVFSKPIFLRNDSLCIFYYGYSCGGLCGSGGLYIYKKTGSDWKPWLELFRWIS